MTSMHQCTKCQFKFELKPGAYLKTGWGRSIVAGFQPLTQQLDDYQKVVCPQCGHVEKDERILSYGLFKPRTLIYVVLLLMALLLLADIFGKK